MLVSGLNGLFHMDKQGRINRFLSCNATKMQINQHLIRNMPLCFVLAILLGVLISIDQTVWPFLGDVTGLECVDMISHMSQYHTCMNVLGQDCLQ